MQIEFISTEKTEKMFDKVLTHEILHILTYKQNQSYQGREQEVETLIEEFEKLSNKT